LRKIGHFLVLSVQSNITSFAHLCLLFRQSSLSRQKAPSFATIVSPAFSAKSNSKAPIFIKPMVNQLASSALLN